jgi:hypothetical protein
MLIHALFTFVDLQAPLVIIWLFIMPFIQLFGNLSFYGSVYTVI